ncbi:MAG: DUF839 domain-containing protein [Bacteroidetes bacterium]|jgi:secreted PhoX family phosphatase|nr:DUF839 domain-containing protein [Bacteroidota bacterium]
MKTISRRNFVKNTSLVSLGFLGLQSFASCIGNKTNNQAGFGELLADPEKIMNLPKGFSYHIISRQGEKMDDGLLVPGLHDGSASFAGSRPGEALLLRNHEVNIGGEQFSAFGQSNEYLGLTPAEKFYDYGRGKNPSMGGVTTVIYDETEKKVKQHSMSLLGTIRNCAGGITPWNSWITCEETVVKADDMLEKNHGYNFDVPASADLAIADPVPLKAMGRFNHEAVVVDPETGIVYQTEDRDDGLLYRFLPDEYGKLHKGGKLQALAIQAMESCDTRNWNEKNIPLNKEFTVEWIDIEDVESPEDSLRYQGADKGAAIFARGEGAWFGNNEFYFACTNGGPEKLGQVFRFKTAGKNNNQKESISLFAESNDSDIMKYCDNLTIAPWGDILLCEDDPHPFIVGITPKGDYYKFGENIGYQSELTGINFSPSGETLFVNIQTPGLTLAITGPWKKSQVT